MRERGQPFIGARFYTAEGDGDSAGARRRPLAHRPTTADRECLVVVGWRACGTNAGSLGNAATRFAHPGKGPAYSGNQR